MKTAKVFRSPEHKLMLVELGNNIKCFREEINMTQQQLAAECDFEKSNMNRIEKGVTNPTLITLVKIAKALKMTLSKLLGVCEKHQN